MLRIAILPPTEFCQSRPTVASTRIAIERDSTSPRLIASEAMTPSPGESILIDQFRLPTSRVVVTLSIEASEVFERGKGRPDISLGPIEKHGSALIDEDISWVDVHVAERIGHAESIELKHHRFNSSP